MGYSRLCSLCREEVEEMGPWEEKEDDIEILASDREGEKRHRVWRGKFCFRYAKFKITNK